MAKRKIADLAQQIQNNLKRDYESGQLALVPIARKYGIAEPSLRAWATAHGWVRKPKPKKKPIIEPKFGQVRVEEERGIQDHLTTNIEALLNQIEPKINGIVNLTELKVLIDAARVSVEGLKRSIKLPPVNDDEDSSVQPGFAAIRKAVSRFGRRLSKEQARYLEAERDLITLETRSRLIEDLDFLKLVAREGEKERSVIVKAAISLGEKTRSQLRHAQERLQSLAKHNPETAATPGEDQDSIRATLEKAEALANAIMIRLPRLMAVAPPSPKTDKLVGQIAQAASLTADISRAALKRLPQRQKEVSFRHDAALAANRLGAELLGLKHWFSQSLGRFLEE